MEKSRKILSFALAALCLLILALFAYHCIDIYLIGNSPSNLSESGVHLSPVFSREIVAERLGRMVPWLVLCLLLVIACLALGYKNGREVPVSAENRLRLVKSRLAQLPEPAMKEERFRRNVYIGCGAAVLLCAVPCLVYLVNGDNFSSWDLEMVIAQLAIHVLPFVLIAFALMIGASLAAGRSIERELEAIKAAGTKPGAKNESIPNEGGKYKNLLRIILYAAAIAFVVLGVTNGGARDVLVKAINICTECIGLG